MEDNIVDLCKDIDALRTVLNEMSAALLDGEAANNPEVLSISKKLDILIVKYSLLVGTDNIDSNSNQL